MNQLSLREVETGDPINVIEMRSIEDVVNHDEALSTPIQSILYNSERVLRILKLTLVPIKTTRYNPASTTPYPQHSHGRDDSCFRSDLPLQTMSSVSSDDRSTPSFSNRIARGRSKEKTTELESISPAMGM